jgi:hypothetical protein
MHTAFHTFSPLDALPICGSGLVFIIAIQFRPVQMALSIMVELVASPFVALLRMVAR